MNRFEELKTFVLSLEDEFYKFYEKENKAAGVRVRKSMQTLKKMAQEIRTDVSDCKTSMEQAKDSA